MNAKWQKIPFFHTVLAIWYNLYVTRSYKWALLQFISRISGHGSCHFEDYLLVHQNCDIQNRSSATIHIRQIFIPFIAMIAEDLGAGVDGGWDGVVQMPCSSHGAFGPGGQDCANVTKSQDHQLVCANSTTWAHLPMSGWRTHPQFCLPGQRWLPWPSPALKHIPGPNQCQCWRKRLASTNMHFRKRPVIRHRTPCWCPSKMPLISPLHIRWASSYYQSLSQLRLTKKYIQVYSSGQYSIASQHYDPELSTVSVTVPDLSYHLQVVCRNKFVCCLLQKSI